MSSNNSSSNNNTSSVPVTTPSTTMSEGKGPSSSSLVVVSSSLDDSKKDIHALVDQLQSMGFHKRVCFAFSPFTFHPCFITHFTNFTSSTL
jgi:hypothetical protein